MKRKWKSKIIVIYYRMKHSNSSRSTRYILKFSVKTTINSKKLTSICRISAKISIKTRRSFSTEMRTEYQSKLKLPRSWTPPRIWSKKWNTTTSCISGWRRSRCCYLSKRKSLCLEISHSYLQLLLMSWYCFHSRESLVKNIIVTKLPFLTNNLGFLGIKQMLKAIWYQQINVIQTNIMVILFLP